MNILRSGLRAFGLLGLACVVSACTSVMQDEPRPQRAATVDRMYVIDCGENHAKDVSLWTTTAADKGKAYVFSNNCYLIRHRTGWMLWDSGNSDLIATMAKGLVNPRGTLTAYMSKPLAESLKEIGVTPEGITHFAMSHSHGDHSGNAKLFARSTIYMQIAEYDAIYGPTPQKLGITPANFENLREARIVKLNGDHDVFGDGSVVIKPTPGHSPGHQSLVVRLPKTGPVLLSGDFVHLKSNWEARRVPSFNYSIEQSVRSMNEMDAFIKATGAQLWINHDSEQSRAIPKAPAFVE
jgi:glyoxylase-like metal-dependent hydrolase (beta-lactamase superfamily II)